MPLITSAGECGPSVLVHVLDIPDLDAKAACGWQSGKGTEPAGLMRALRKYGYKAAWSQGNTVESLVAFLSERKHPIVIVDFYDTNFGSIDGHYAQFLGLDSRGHVRVWNPDTPDKEEFLLPRIIFESFWYDYTIDTHDLMLRVAIFAHKV